MAEHIYQVRVHVRRSDGRIFGFAVDRLPALMDAIEAVDNARHILTEERGWCFDADGWAERPRPQCVRDLFTDPQARGWLYQAIDEDAAPG